MHGLGRDAAPSGRKLCGTTLSTFSKGFIIVVTILMKTPVQHIAIHSAFFAFVQTDMKLNESGISIKT